jgi:predicted negative regulator of RcsB-dependent stress response
LGAKKIKISKKEALKAQKALELTTIPVLSREWIELHLSKILTGLGALLLVLGMVWAFNAYSASKEQRARLEYAVVLQNWPADDNSTRQAWEKVITELEGYLKEYSGTPPGTDAQLDLARAYFQTQQYENALQWTQKVFDQSPRDQGLKILAQYQLAPTLEALGKFDDAISLWNALRSKDSPDLAREADWNIARLYARKGEYIKAQEGYNAVLKASGNYPNTALVQDELASLKLKMEASGGQKASGQ